MAVLGLLVLGPGTAARWISNWEGRQTKEYFQRFELAYARLRGSGTDPALFDSDVPAHVLQRWYSPYTRLSNVLTLFHPKLRFWSEFGLGWAVDDRGDIRRASFEHTSDVLPLGSNARLSARQGQLSLEGHYTCFAGSSSEAAWAEVSFERAPSGQYFRIEHPNVGGWLKVLTRDEGKAWEVLTNNDDAEPLDRQKVVEVLKLRRAPGKTVYIEVISAARACLRVEMGELHFLP